MQTLTPMFGSGVKYSLPADKVDSFKQDFGEQAEDGVSLRTKDGQSYTIPRSQTEAFKTDFPDAQEVRTFQMADGTTRQMTVPEVSKFIRSKEYRESQDFADERKRIEASLPAPTVKEDGRTFSDELSASGGGAVGRTVGGVISGLFSAFGQQLRNAAVASPLGMPGQTIHGGDPKKVQASMQNNAADRAGNVVREWTDILFPDVDASNGFQEANKKAVEFGTGLAKFGIMASNPLSLAALVAESYGNAAAETFDTGIRNGMSVEDASGLANIRGMVDAGITGAFAGAPVKRLAGALGLKTPEVAAPQVASVIKNGIGAAKNSLSAGIAKAMAVEAGKAAIEMGSLSFAQGMFDNAVMQEAEHPDQPIDWMAAAKAGGIDGLEQATVGAVLGLLPTPVRISRARRGIEKGMRDALATPEGAEAYYAQNREGAAGLIKAFNKNGKISRTDAREAGLPEMSEVERNELAQNLTERLKAEVAPAVEKQKIAEERRSAEAEMEAEGHKAASLKGMDERAQRKVEMDEYERAEAERKAREAEEEAGALEVGQEAAIEEAKQANARAAVEAETNAAPKSRTEEYPEYANWLKHKFRTDTDKNWNRFVAENGLDPALKVERGREAKPSEVKEEEAQPATEMPVAEKPVEVAAEKTVETPVEKVPDGKGKMVEKPTDDIDDIPHATISQEKAGNAVYNYHRIMQLRQEHNKLYDEGMKILKDEGKTKRFDEIEKRMDANEAEEKWLMQHPDAKLGDYEKSLKSMTKPDGKGRMVKEKVPVAKEAPETIPVASAPKKVESTAPTAAKPADPAKRVPDGKGRMKTEESVETQYDRAVKAVESAEKESANARSFDELEDINSRARSALGKITIEQENELMARLDKAFYDNQGRVGNVRSQGGYTPSMEIIEAKSRIESMPTSTSREKAAKKKAQKDWLLSSVDDAIKSHGDTRIANGKPFAESFADEFESLIRRRNATYERDKLDKLNKQIDTAKKTMAQGDMLTFDVPDDGTFKIRNNPEALALFKRMVQKRLSPTNLKEGTLAKAEKPLAEDVKDAGIGKNEAVGGNEKANALNIDVPRTPEAEIADRASMHRLDPKLRSEPAVLAWAKKRGRVVDNGMVSADARREYDREQAMGAAKLSRNWFPDMKVTYHDYGENVKRGQHVLDFRVGIRGAENANDIPAMRGYNIAEKMLKEKPWNQMSIEEKRKFNLATGYQVGADGMLKREVPDFALKGDFSDKIKSIDDSLSLVHKMMDEYDANEKSRKYGTPIFEGIRDYYLRDGNLRKFISGIRYPEVKEKLEPIADAIDSLEKNKAVVFSGKLVDVIDGDGAKLLKRYYPDIDKIRFSIQHSDEAGLMGWFDPNKNEIVMTQNGISRGFEDVYGTILHETQHFVQHKEGFGVGGSSSAKILNTFRGLDYIIRDPAALVSDIDNLINPPSDVYGIVLKDAIERKIAYMFPNVDIKDTGSLRSLSEKIKKSIPYIDYVKSKMEREGLKFTNDPYFDYKRLMGEVESRDVQYRMQHPENKGRLFEETEEFPSHEQIDNRSFSELLELASERRVDDGNIMRLRDRAGNTLGWFDPNSKEVHLLPGANAETVAHEIMWHGTRDWAKTESAKGNSEATRLLNKMHEVENACPASLKKAILRAYRKTGVTDPDTLLNEFGAWDAMVNGGKALGKELQKRENAVWYARWWNAAKDLIKSYLARHGKNRVDFSDIDGMTTDEFKDFLAAQFAGGKTLGEIVPKAGKTVSTDETKLQKARRVVYDVNASIRDLERDIEKAHVVKIKFDESAEAANALTPGLREAELLATSATEREYREILDAGKLSNADVEAYMGAKAAAGRDAKVDAKNLAQIAKDVERDLRAEWGTDKIAKDTAAFDAELQNRVAAAQAAYNSTNGSHIDQREARVTVRETETGSHAAEYANARAKLRAVMDETLQVQKDAGLISEELYNKLKTEEPDYVPFKNEYDVETGEAYGRGVNNFTKPEFYEARGRQSAAGDIVAHIFQDNLSAKHRAIENGVREKLAKLVERFHELGTVEKIGEAWKEKQKSLSDRKDKANQTGDPNVVMFKRNGDTYAIRLNGTRGAAIAAGITERNVMRFSDLLGDKVGDKLNKFSRFQAGLATRYAPFFAFRNLPKDNIELGNIVLSERGLLEGSRWIKDYVASYKGTAGALSKFVLTGKVDASTPGGQVLQRYIDAGGLISGGGTEGYDAQSIRKRMDPKFIEKEMKRCRSKTYATLQYAKRGLGYLSEMSELMTRVNAFNAELKAGKSDGEAALFSRRATVDFNRHGELTGVTNVLRLFSNSTLGATARATAALANSKGGRSMAAILFANGMARVALEHLMNDEDDKGRETAGTGTGRDVPEYERQTSLFYVRNGENVFKIAEHESPFSLITYAGDTLARVLYGDISVGQAAKNLGVSTAEVAFHLTGLGSLNLTSREGGLESDSKAALVSLAPSLVQPAVEVITGVDYKGDPISMQLFDTTDVRSHHPRANTPDYQVKTAQFLNWITGGNAGRRGYADLSPEAVGKLIEGYGKNALREGLMAYDLAKAMVGDKKWSEIDVGQKPLVRDWVRPIRGNTNRYYDAKRTRKEDRKDFDANRATMSVEERYAYATAHPSAVGTRSEAMGKLETSIRRLQKMARGFAYKNGKAVPHEWSEEKVKEFEKRRLELQAKYLKLMETPGK